jgi:hypothetical protein
MINLSAPSLVSAIAGTSLSTFSLSGYVEQEYKSLKKGSDRAAVCGKVPVRPGY